MANQIEVTVYQIDGCPQKTPISISFLTSDIMIMDASIFNISAVKSALVYYKIINNKLQVQYFYVSETLEELLTAANFGTITQLKATVKAIDNNVQIPSGVNYSFPANNISIWTSIDTSLGTNSFIQYKEKNYATVETVSQLISKSNIVPSSGLFAQTANSTAITASTTEGTLIDGGVGTLSVPANLFRVGDSFVVNISGIMSAQNNNTITIRVKTGSVILADSGPLTMPAITNQVWNLNLYFTIRTLGGAGVASIVTLGELHILKLASGTQQGFGFNTINNSTFDTTISNTLDVTAQWSTNNANNSIYSDLCVLTKVY